MQITDIRVRKANVNEGKVKAHCSVVFDDMFVVHDVRVVGGTNGVFVAMPRRKTSEGEFKDLAHPITAEARDMIQRAVLEAFQEFENKQVIIASESTETVTADSTETVTADSSETVTADSTDTVTV